MVPGNMDETLNAPVADKARFSNRLTRESGGPSLATKPPRETLRSGKLNRDGAAQAREASLRKPTQ
jgi:hypothetical protein